MKNTKTKDWIHDYLHIVDKNGERIPFRLNKIQDKFLTEDMTGRDIVLKARQQGFSSLILAMFTKDFLLKQNTYNVVVADDTDNAQGLLKRVKDYIACWCEAMGIQPKDILKYNSKYELYFEAMNSTYHIGTAQNTQFGRSRTITNLHLSEVAFYPHMSEILAGALQAVVPTGRVILETTANGFNEFKDYWDNAKLGDSSFTPHFYPASAFYDIEFLEQKKKELGRMFKQEYPNSDIESFITSGETFFNQEALEFYLQNIKQPIQEGVVYV